MTLMFVLIMCSVGKVIFCRCVKPCVGLSVIAVGLGDMKVGINRCRV